MTIDVVRSDNDNGFAVKTNQTGKILPIATRARVRTTVEPSRVADCSQSSDLSVGLTVRR